MSAAMVDGYELESELGRGASSVVYIACQTALGGRRVALKLIQRADLDDVALRRFERERASLAKLSAVSGVVTVFDAGITSTGWPWISMELMPGGSLADWLRTNGPMDLTTALGVAVAVGEALATAHDQGILHRDIKPENVLLDDRGQPKIADFGIASVSDMGATRSSSASLRGFTGTIAHAAPELLSGAAPTAQSDIYALGSTLFAMIAGHAPYVRHGEDNILAILRRVAIEPVPRLETYGVPTTVADVIARSLAVEPAERPDSVTEFINQLRHAASNTGITPALAGVGFVPVAAATPSPVGAAAVASSQVNDTWSSQTIHQFTAPEPAAPEPTRRPRARTIAIAAVAATLTIGGTAAALLNSDAPTPPVSSKRNAQPSSTTEPAETTASQTTEAATTPTTGTGAFNGCPDWMQLDDHDGDGWGACTIPTTVPREVVASSEILHADDGWTMAIPDSWIVESYMEEAKVANIFDSGYDFAVAQVRLYPELAGVDPASYLLWIVDDWRDNWPQIRLLREQQTVGSDGVATSTAIYDLDGETVLSKTLLVDPARGLLEAEMFLYPVPGKASPLDRVAEYLPFVETLRWTDGGVG